MLIPTRCPIDGTDDADVEVYPASFDLDQVTAEVFSARRRPDRLHYRMVRNTRTGCLRANPILDQDTIHKLYERSVLTYGEIAGYAANTYVRQAESVLPLLPDRRGLLEIGCGNGFFLERMMDKGFERVAGIEPSADAVQKASPTIAPCIHQGLLEADTHPVGSFSLICGFQVLDHLADPNQMLEICRQLLVPGGVMLWICHDVGAPLARLLGERCPIVDIEHTVLYSRKTAAELFRRRGFEVLRVSGVSNSYPLSYWSSLAPLPGWAKAAVSRVLGFTRLGRVPAKVNLGNMAIVARNPV